MKNLLTLVLGMSLLTVGCDKKSTDSEDDNNGKTYSTVNVKNATEYFNFANNSGSTDAGSAHDVVFYSLLLSPAPGAPQISFPYFKAKDGLSIAPMKDTNLEDVTEVPATSEFVTNYSTEGDDWFHMVNGVTVVPDENVYIVNTADGKFPAFQITNYYDEQGNSGVYTFEWKYLN